VANIKTRRIQKNGRVYHPCEMACDSYF